MKTGPRLRLTDRMWRRLAPKIPDLRRCSGVNDAAARRFIEGVLWIWSTGAPWRDLPPPFGRWFTVYQRFRRWAAAGIWRRIYRAVLGASCANLGTASIDSTSVRVHQHACAAPKRAVGRSRGGRTTKVHAVVANDKTLLAWHITPGQHADIRSAPGLLSQARRAHRVVADRAYDADSLRAWLRARGVDAVIPPRQRRKNPARFKREHYTPHLKQFRRVATRYDRRRACFAAGILAVATFYQLKEAS